MLPRVNRLTKEQDFKRLALKGRFFFNRLFNIKVMSAQGSASRFGVVISAKVSKKATARNLMKRRITEYIRLHLSQIKSGIDAMIIVKKEILAEDYNQIGKELKLVFSKAGFWLMNEGNNNEKNYNKTH